jgi:hypothetical protein
MDTDNQEMPPKALPAPTQKICMDVPLFIKVLEYCHDVASDDVELHRILTNAIEMSKKKECLDMIDYVELLKDVKGNELDYLKKLAGLEAQAENKKGIKKDKR